jgi:hypothetical protein
MLHRISHIQYMDWEPLLSAWCWFVLQEWCNLGTLHSVALEWQISGDGDLQMFERLSLLVDAARGLKYLHSKDIIHGDLVRICSSLTPVCCASLRKVLDLASRHVGISMRHLDRSAAQGFGPCFPACGLQHA